MSNIKIEPRKIPVKESSNLTEKLFDVEDSTNEPVEVEQVITKKNLLSNNYKIAGILFAIIVVLVLVIIYVYYLYNNNYTDKPKLQPKDESEKSTIKDLEEKIKTYEKKISDLEREKMENAYKSLLLKKNNDKLNTKLNNNSRIIETESESEGVIVENKNVGNKTVKITEYNEVNTDTEGNTKIVETITESDTSKDENN